MTVNKIGPRSQMAALRWGKPRPAIATELFLVLLLIGILVLFIPSLPLRAAVIIGWGGLIFSYERYLGLPVPASPGTMLWFGSTLSYVVGGLGTDLIYEQLGTNFLYNELPGFGLRYLESTLLYLGLGLGSYAFGLWLAGQRLGPAVHRRDVVFELTFRKASVWLVGLLYLLPVLGKGVDSSSETGTPTVYYNLIIGALMSIERVPMILLAFYLMRPHPRWWVGLLFLGAALTNPLGGILLGYGRAIIPWALVALVSVWLALVWYTGHRVSRRAKLLIALLPLCLVIFFGVSTAYRRQVGLDRTLTLEERLQIAQESSAQFARSENVVIDTIGPFVNRLLELPSLELLGWAESGLIEPAGWTLGDSKQVLLAWIPKTFFPEKGKGYGRDIMEFYGLCSSSNNIPVTLLTDAYRRLGLVGVLGIYFLMGVASTTLALKLLPRWGALGLVLVFYFALLHLTIYGSEVLEVFKLYVYRLPASGLVILVLLRLTRIWQPPTR